MYKVKRLAQAMEMWKDMFFWLKLGVVSTKRVNRAFKGLSSIIARQPFPQIDINSGPFIYADRFEDMVLGREQFAADDWNKFSIQYTEEDEHGEFLNNALSDINSLPFNIWKWSRGARRVFHITEELQMFLEATHLGETLWEDITFPFDYFYISLDSPIDGSEHQYDGILVSVYDTEDFMNVMGATDSDDAEILPKRMLDITLFPNELGNFDLLPAYVRRGYQKAVKHKGYEKLLKLMTDSAVNGFERPHLGRLMLITDDFDMTPISTSISDLLKNEAMAEMLGGENNQHLAETFSEASKETALKLVLGLCLYLECGESQSNQVVINRPAETDGHSLDEKHIAKSCDFYNVQLDYQVLTEEEKDFLKSDPKIKRAYREMGFHWRRAHKRYAPGVKQIPGAVKTIKVKACRVRADKAPNYGVVAGARHILTKKS